MRPAIILANIPRTNTIKKFFLQFSIVFIFFFCLPNNKKTLGNNHRRSKSNGYVITNEAKNKITPPIIDSNPETLEEVLDIIPKNTPPK